MTERGGLALVTRRQLAQVFGKDNRTIARWLEDGMPCATPGRGGQSSMFSIPACVQWYIARELQIRGAEEADAVSPSVSLSRLNAKRTEELELKLQVRRGQLVEAEAVAHEFADLAVAVKSRIRAVPDAVADQLVGLSPAEVKRLLLAKLDDALRELARGAELVSVPAEDEIEDDDETGPEAAHP